MKSCLNGSNFGGSVVRCGCVILLIVGSVRADIGIRTPPPIGGLLASADGDNNADGQVDPFEMSLDELAELKVVVDVASLFDENELIVGSTVELITRENWRRRGSRTVADAIGSSPAVLVAPVLWGGSMVAIRGYTTGQSTRGVNTQLDGVPLNTLKTGTALFDLHSIQLGALDRIEMIRGPGSALHGADAFHGVLSLKTFESDVDVVEVDGAFGTDHYRQGAIRMSRAVSDNLRFNGAVSYNGTSDQDERYKFTHPVTMTQMTGERANRFDSYMGVFKLQSDPETQVSARGGLYLKGHNQGGFPGNGRDFASRLSESQDRDFSESDSRFYMVTTGLTVKLPENIELDINAFHWDQDDERKIDLTRVAATNLFQPERERRTGVSVFLKQPDNGWNTQWVAGYEFQRAVITESLTLFIPPIATPSGPDGATDATRETHSLVFQGRTSFCDDQLHVLYGARFDDYSDTSDHTSPRFGVIYQPTEDSAIKLLYGNALRPPTALETGGQPGISLAAPLAPEIIDTFELVFIKQTDHWKAFVTVFQSDWEDAIRFVVNPMAPPAFRRVNIGKNEAYGVEAGFTYIKDNFRADVSASFVESEDKTNNNDYVAFPKFIINLGVGSTIEGPCGGDVQLYLNNRIHLDAAESPIIAGIPNPPDLKDYWRTDLTATWRHPEKNLDVFVNFLNVFDRNNFLPAGFSAEGGIPDIGFTAVFGFRCAS